MYEGSGSSLRLAWTDETISLVGKFFVHYQNSFNTALFLHLQEILCHLPKNKFQGLANNIFFEKKSRFLTSIMSLWSLRNLFSLAAFNEPLNVTLQFLFSFFFFFFNLVGEGNMHSLFSKEFKKFIIANNFHSARTLSYAVSFECICGEYITALLDSPSQRLMRCGRKIPINSYLSLGLFFLHVSKPAISGVSSDSPWCPILCTTLYDYIYAHAMVSTVYKISTADPKLVSFGICNRSGMAAWSSAVTFMLGFYGGFYS